MTEQQLKAEGRTSASGSSCSSQRIRAARWATRTGFVVSADARPTDPGVHIIGPDGQRADRRGGGGDGVQGSAEDIARICRRASVAVGVDEGGGLVVDKRTLNFEDADACVGASPNALVLPMPQLVAGGAARQGSVSAVDAVRRLRCDVSARRKVMIAAAVRCAHSAADSRDESIDEVELRAPTPACARRPTYRCGAERLGVAAPLPALRRVPPTVQQRLGPGSERGRARLGGAEQSQGSRRLGA